VAFMGITFRGQKFWPHFDPPDYASPVRDGDQCGKARQSEKFDCLPWPDPSTRGRRRPTNAHSLRTACRAIPRGLANDRRLAQPCGTLSFCRALASKDETVEADKPSEYAMSLLEFPSSEYPST
jgi:hypothetical protein